MLLFFSYFLLAVRAFRLTILPGYDFLTSDGGGDAQLCCGRDRIGRKEESEGQYDTSGAVFLAREREGGVNNYCRQIEGRQAWQMRNFIANE